MFLLLSVGWKFQVTLVIFKIPRHVYFYLFLTNLQHSTSRFISWTKNLANTQFEQWIVAHNPERIAKDITAWTEWLAGSGGALHWLGWATAHPEKLKNQRL